MADSSSSVGGWQVPAVLMGGMPRLTYHSLPLSFMSEPGITQAQYEQMISSGRENPAPDEIITVKCPNVPDGTGTVFQVKKSTLIRSPAFARFCESEDYRPGCHMQLTFTIDPGVCFEVAVHYLEEGPDQYGQTRLSVFLRTHFKLRDRFIVLVRLYQLASRMELPGLVDVTVAVMDEYEKDMTAGYCITVASLVFGHQSGLDKRMREWSMKHIRNYFCHLSRLGEWTQVAVPGLDLDLRQRWAKLVEQNKRVMAAIQEESLETEEDDADDDMGMSSHSVHHRIQELKVEEAHHNVTEQGSDSNQEWEPEEYLLQEPERFVREETARFSRELARRGKAASVPGLAPSKTTDGAAENHIQRTHKRNTSHLEVGPVSSPELAKARAVLGMNMLDTTVATVRTVPKKEKKTRRLSKRVHQLLHFFEA